MTRAKRFRLASDVAVRLLALTIIIGGAAWAADTHTISGTVSGESGAPVAGVSVACGGVLSAVTTDEAGRYSIPGAVEGESYTIVPAKAGMTFRPASRTVTMGSGDEIASFTAQVAGGGLLANGGLEDDAAGKQAPSFPTVIYPNGGEAWEQGKSYNIQWTYNGPGPMRIWLSGNGGATVYQITAGTPNDGSFWWKVPATIPPATDYVIDVAGPFYGDTSDHSFSIAEKPLVTYPNNSGVSWRRGQAYKITWQGFGGSNVKIQLYKSGVLSRLIAWSTPNDGAFWWKVPDNQAPGTTYRIKVTGQSKALVSDDSDKNFIIAGVQSVTWPSDEAIIWAQGEAYPIQWNGYVGPNVRIELLKNWSLHQVVTTGTPNDGQFWWRMPWPTTPGADYRIRITATNDSTQKDHSNNNFTVTPVPHVNYPSSSGIIWGRGMTYAIKWSGFAGSQVKILLIRDGCGEIAQITAGTANDGRFVFQVPPSVPTGSGYRIQVSTSYKLPAQMDESDRPFLIAVPL